MKKHGKVTATTPPPDMRMKILVELELEGRTGVYAGVAWWLDTHRALVWCAEELASPTGEYRARVDDRDGTLDLALQVHRVADRSEVASASGVAHVCTFKLADEGQRVALFQLLERVNPVMELTGALPRPLTHASPLAGRRRLTLPLHTVAQTSTRTITTDEALAVAGAVERPSPPSPTRSYASLPTVDPGEPTPESPVAAVSVGGAWIPGVLLESHARELTGVLTVSRGAQKIDLVLRAGAPVHVRLAGGESLEQRLLLEGPLTGAQCAEAKRSALDQGLSFEDALVGQGRITSSSYRRIQRSWAREAVQLSMGWRDATWRFEEDTRTPGDVPGDLGLDLTEVVLKGVTRSLDEEAAEPAPPLPAPGVRPPARSAPRRRRARPAHGCCTV